ncbi:MAG: A24 family peptidase [Clostridiales bacterium]|nr:A24 family peptidase [Clostridiales bacterium]
MSVLWSLAWGCVSFVTLAAWYRWQLPKLLRQQEHAEPVPTDESATEPVTEVLPQPAATQPKRGLLLAALGCVPLACLCGYQAAQCANSPISILKLLLAYCVLACAALADVKFFRIPHPYVLTLLVGRVLFLVPELIFTYEGTLSRLLSSVVGGLGCMLFLMLVSKISHGGLGYGDVKLFGGLGFLCGLYGAAYTLLFSCILCALASASLLLFRKKTLKDTLPMGPFVLLGFVVTVLLAMY